MDFPLNIIVALSNINITWLVFALIFIGLDILTGICKAASQHNIDSGKMRTGFWHKLAIIMALVVAGIADAALNAGMDIGINVPIFGAACCYVCIMELISILENISEINPELKGSKLFDLFSKNTDDNIDDSKK